MQQYKYYIGGNFKQTDKVLSVINPATASPVAETFQASVSDVALACEKAKQACRKWRKVSFNDRAKVLRDIAGCIMDNLSVLAELETKQIGKPLKESLFVDVPLAADCFTYYASFLESLKEEAIPSESGIDLVRYDPFGVAAVFLPYNVPLMIFGFSCAAALAAGNSLVIKPSEYGSLSILELIKYIDKLDIPEGLINVVTGSGETIGRALAESKADIISFTGSRKTLKKIVGFLIENPKKIICELGGCNLSFVFSDAQKDQALQNILAASFMKQGQICIGTSIVLVQENIYKDFIKELVKKASQIKIGDPFMPDTGIGALPTEEHLRGVQKRVEALISKGNKLLCGGTPLSGKGHFYPPTIIEIKDIVYDEFFAPVILVKSFKDELKAQQIIEENPTGLVLQLWTDNLEKANRLADSADCGTVWINTFVQMSSATCFGGAKQSGWGRNLGRFGFFEYIQPKHIGVGFKPSPVCGWFGV